MKNFVNSKPHFSVATESPLLLAYAVNSFQTMARQPLMLPPDRKELILPALISLPPAKSTLLEAIPPISEPPQITRALDQVGVRQGALGSGSITDDRYIIIEGTGAPDAYLEILDNGEIIGKVQVDNEGRWSFKPAQGYSESGHVLTVRIMGSNESSTPFAVIVDTVAPSRTFIDNVSDGGTIDRNGHTSNSSPVIKGRAEPNCMVAIYSNKTLIGTSYSDASGNWTFSSAFPMPDGSYSFTANAIDFSGNTGLSSSNYKITIDTVAPLAPTIECAIDDVGLLQGTLQSGATTDDRTPSLSGKTESNATVFVYDNDILLGTTRADANGHWLFTPEVVLTDGTHLFSVTAGDAAGNSSLPSAAYFTLKIGTPVPSIEEVLDAVGAIRGLISNGGYTDDTTPTLSGQSEPGTTVHIYDNGKLLGSAEVAENGAWKFTPATPLSEGQHGFSATAQDIEGNVSEYSPLHTVIIDVTAPDQAASIISMSKDSGFDSADWLTNDGSAGRLIEGTLSATLGSHEKLQISSDGGQTWVDAWVDGSQWAAQDNNSHNQSWTVQTRVIDSLGQSGSLSTQHVVLDNTPPKAPFFVKVDGQTVTVTFDKGDVKVGHRINLISGDQRYDHELTEQDVTAGQIIITPPINVSPNVAAGIVDTAGNVSDYLWTLKGSENFDDPFGIVYSGRQFGEILFSSVSGAASTGRYDQSGREERSIIQLYSGTVVELKLPENSSQFTIALNNAGAYQNTQYIKIYDIAGNLIGQPQMNTSEQLWYDISYSAPAGVTIGSIIIYGGDNIYLSTMSYTKMELVPFAETQSVTMSGTGGIYAGDKSSTIIVENKGLLDRVEVSGGAGVDQIKLTGAEQTLDLSALGVRISSVEIVDITGTGNNTLKLSLGDVLENGSKDAFTADDNVQLLVNGNIGDKLILDDLLHNHIDAGDWLALGPVTLDGVAYQSYVHSAFNAEVLVQQAVTVDLV